MERDTNERTPMRHRYLNVILTINAALLACVVLGVNTPGFSTPAMASESLLQPEGGLVSAGEQRKQMIAELRALNNKIERLETKLDKELRVIITKMSKVEVSGD